MSSGSPTWSLKWVRELRAGLPTGDSSLYPLPEAAVTETRLLDKKRFDGQKKGQRQSFQ